MLGQLGGRVGGAARRGPSGGGLEPAGSPQAVDVPDPGCGP